MSPDTRQGHEQMGGGGEEDMNDHSERGKEQGQPVVEENAVAAVFSQVKKVRFDDMHRGAQYGFKER